MKPSLRLLPLIALTAAAIPAASSLDLDAARSQSPATALSLNLPRSEPDALADRGRKGPSAGDELYITDRLTDERRMRVGSIVAQGSLFSRDLRRAQMTATISLTGRGSIALQGTLNFAARRNQGTLAIVGGTGQFADAGGTAKVTMGRRGVVKFDLALTP